MKTLINLFLTVVCVHCIPLYEDGIEHYTDKQHKENNDTVDPNLVDRIKFMNDLSFVGKLDFVPDFISNNKLNVTTSDRPTDATPTTYPPYSGYINCGGNCILNQPPWAMQNSPLSTQNNPWAMQNSPSAMQYIPRPIPNSPWAMQYIPWPIPNSPSAMQYIPSPIPNSPSAIQYIPWPMQNSPLAVQCIPCSMQNSPWAIPSYPSVEPDNQLDTSNNPTYGTSTDAPNDTTNDTSQQNPSFVSTTERIP